MNILVINCGSSSAKYKLIAMPDREVLASGLIERIGEDCSRGHQKTSRGIIDEKISAKDHKEAIHSILSFLTDKEKGAVTSFEEIEGFGHRVVHGGENYPASVIVNDQVLEDIDDLRALAPLHNGPNLTGIKAAMAVAPDRPQVVCFDTSFHQTLPPKAFRYAIPEKLYTEERIRRYGAHGTSHRYVSRRAAEITGKDVESSRWITCHLGNGASMAAIRDGRCVDTSMGLTPLEGLVMGTRCGDLDPAVLIHLGRLGWSFERLAKLLNHESGLLGLSGISNDMRELEMRAEAGSESSQLAIDVFCYRVKKYLGSFLAVLDGCDGIVFTGGIGEHGVKVREKATEGLSRLGVQIDCERNRNLRGAEGVISPDGAETQVLVIPTDEEGEIAWDTYCLIGGC
tara:strand:+ start:1011 stop:2207 length:1197 start_codon:yes stop_codon:yes gene_type:complete